MADPLVRVALAEKWLEVIPLIPLLAAAGAANMLQTNTFAVYGALGRPRLIALTGGIQAALLVPMLLAAVSWLGLVGVAGAFLLHSVLFALPIAYWLADGTVLPYDVLIVATGTRLAPEETEGLTGPGWLERVFTFYTPEGAEALGGALTSFEGGKLVVNIVDMPIKCPVAPIEFEFLADWHLRERGIRDRTEIVLAMVDPDDYALVDCGDGRRLERFGALVFDRPSAGAVEPRRLPDRWAGAARYLRGSGWWAADGTPLAETSGVIAIAGATVEVRPVASGQVGLFPEHALNAAWLTDAVRAHSARTEIAMGPPEMVRIRTAMRLLGLM